MKKLFAIVLIFIFLLALSSCGQKNKVDTTPIMSETKDVVSAVNSKSESTAQSTVCKHENTIWQTIKSATCTESEIQQKICSDCKTELERKTISSSGHIMVNDVCKVCGYKYETKNADPTCSHIWGNWIAEKVATCSSTGSDIRTCSKCKATQTNQTASLGHDFINHAAKSATCLQSGFNAFVTCSRCEYSTFKEISAKGHQAAIDNAIDATCLHSGLTEGTHCSVCNATLISQNVVPAKGHTIVVDLSVAATCTKSGLTEGKHCSVCNSVLLMQNVISATGHDFAPATYTKPKTCKTCGATEGAALTPYINITKPSLPAKQNSNFMVTAVSYTTEWDSENGTYTIKVYGTATNITSSKIVGGVWFELYGDQNYSPVDGTAKTSLPGEIFTSTAIFRGVKPGNYNLVL